MEETLVHSVLLSVPQAAGIWLVILAVAVIAVAALSLPGRRPARDDPGAAGRRGGDTSGFAAERASADRYAVEIEVAAERAAVTARRGRDAWERAQEHLDLTWAAFEAADRVARRSSAAAAFGTPDDDPSPSPSPAAESPAAEYPAPECGSRVGAEDRERYLHRAATAACRRRELTVHELNDILAHRGDWDPHRHPVLQEVALHRAVRRRALAAYRDATARERQAWHTAEVAADALRSLREEACAARLRVEAPVTTGQLWWAGGAPDATQPLRQVPAPAESMTVALPVGVAADDVEATVALPVGVTADDVEATVALPVRVTADDVEATVPLRVRPVPGGSSPVGPLRVVPLPAAALAALQAATVQLPTMAPQDPGSSTSVSPSSDPSGAVASAEVETTQVVSAQVVPTPVLPASVVPAQAGAPIEESLRQPLATAGADAARR